MRITLFAAATFLVTGAAGAAELTRLDAAQLDWITASPITARVVQEVPRKSDSVVDGQSILKAAKNELDGAHAGGTVTAADSKVPVQGGSALAGDGDAGGIKPIVGGGTMASVSGTGAGSAGAFASQTIASTADGKGAPIVTTSTGGLSTGGFSGSGFAVAPTTTPATTPATAPTTASLGTLTPMSLLGGFSMPTMPSFSVGSGG